MKKEQIAAQLYTLREYNQNISSFARGMKKLADIGFKAVQVSGVPATLKPEDIRKACDDNGLVICATHDSQDNIINNPNAVADKLDIFNCVHTAYPSPTPGSQIDYESVLDLAAALNASAKALAARGKMLSYHNHHSEFRKLNGQRILDTIYANAPDLKAEIDTYWVQMGGGDPVKYVQKYAGRQEIFHLKDFGVIYPRTSVMFPIGSGNLDWDAILEAASKAGVKSYIVEHDMDVSGEDIFESFAKSAKFLQSFIEE